MGNIKMSYLRIKRYKGREYYFWEVPKRYAGFKPLHEPLGKDREKALYRHALLLRSFNDWRRGVVHQRHEQGTVAWLIEQYLKDERHTSKAPGTRVYNERNAGILKDLIGDKMAVDITRQHARQLYQAFAENPRKAQSFVAVARLVFNLGHDLGMVEKNPFSSLNVKTPPPREEVWEQAQIEAVQMKAVEQGMPSVALAVQLAVNTGQRPGDLRNLTWNRYTGTHINLRQSKTGVWVSVPVLPELKIMLDKADRKAPHILICEDTGRPYDKDMLPKKFRKLCREAGIADNMQFRDFRRTTVVRLGQVGCRVYEIAAITGHAMKSVHSILATYMPMNSEFAESAILQLSKVGKKE